MPDKKVRWLLWSQVIFSKATSYGIRALAYLASQPEHRLCGLLEISEHERIPAAYLRKILGELRRQRLLRSVKGIHGGYELGRSAESITLWEVFKALEPDPYMDLCILGCPPTSTCAFHEDWQRVRKELVSLLETRTIAEAAFEISKTEPLGNSPQWTSQTVEDDERWKDEADAIPSPA